MFRGAPSYLLWSLTLSKIIANVAPQHVRHACEMVTIVSGIQNLPINKATNASLLLRINLRASATITSLIYLLHQYLLVGKCPPQMYTHPSTVVRVQTPPYNHRMPPDYKHLCRKLPFPKEIETLTRDLMAAVQAVSRPP